MASTTQITLSKALGAAALAIALTACQSDAIGSGGSGEEPSASPTSSPDASAMAPGPDEPEVEPTQDSDDAQDADGGSGSSSGQVSYVEFGDVRYEAESMECRGNDGGFEMGGDATGPYAGMVTIGGVFGVGSPEDPPDMAFASFDASENGQWSAMSEVSGFSIGSLSGVSYSAAGASGQGTFAFHIGGDIDPASESGSFEFFC